MIPLSISGIGVCASGMPDWATARGMLCGDAEWQPMPLPRLDIPALPAIERRRANLASRLAIDAATQAVAGMDVAALSILPSVFATADGDGQVLANTLDVLAQHNVAMSPTLFHNSVFNAPAGYWTIASRCGGASTTVSAGAGTFAAGVLEAGLQVADTGRPVLMVAFDMPFPAALQSFGVTAAAFSCALVLEATERDGPRWGTLGRWHRASTAMASRLESSKLASAFAGNAAAASLPLLQAIARRHASTVAVPYLDDGCIELAYCP